ncbi:hypothetical protein [Kitasatospora sp. NPDC005751]|uniref:hypothetical protein n=1 Tax=unclassified Kitasatospora TaxID=2633591 RepID=UPI0034031D8E
MPVGTQRQGPEKTADGHFVVIDGRRWRATDPSLPESTAARLRHHLMAARRAVRGALAAGDSEAERDARSRVHAAKTALGERGTPWWEQSPRERRERWERGLADLDASSER